jgi:hypothetical protein
VAEAERVREQEEELREALTEDQMRLAEAVEHRQELERQLAAARAALRTAAKAIADRREGLAKLAGQVDAARRRTGSAAEEIERLAAAHTDALSRADAAQADVGRGRGRVHRGGPGQRRLDARHAEAVAAHDGPPPWSRSCPTPTRRGEGRRELEGPRGGAGARACSARTAPGRCSAGPTRCPACSAASPRC